MEYKKYKLSECCTIIAGQSPESKYYNTDGEGLPFFQGKADFGEVYPKIRVFCSKPVKIADKDDILLSVRAPVGPTNLAPGKVCIGRGLTAIRPSNILLTKYLLLYLKRFEIELANQGTGTTFKAITQSVIKNMEICIPSIHDQERIVTQIEETLSQLDSAVETLKKTKQQLEVYRQAVLRKHFDCGYEARKLKELCFFITKGTTPAKKELFSGHGEIPFVKVYNLTFTNKLDFSIDPTFVSNATHKGFLKRSITYPGDVLMNIVGPPMGKVSIVPRDYPEWNINQAIARFRCGEKLNNKFLAYYLGFSDTINKLKSKSKATAGQFNLTLEICREIEIPLPDIEEQQRIVEEIEYRLCMCDSIVDTINQTLQQAEALRQSILKGSFQTPE